MPPAKPQRNFGSAVDIISCGSLWWLPGCAIQRGFCEQLFRVLPLAGLKVTLYVLIGRRAVLYADFMKDDISGAQHARCR